MAAPIVQRYVIATGAEWLKQTVQVRSSSEAEISNYFWIFRNCHRQSKFYLVLKYQ